MIKAIFWLIVFFFFISVLFYGIRFILVGIANLFRNEKQIVVHLSTVMRAEPETIAAPNTADHQLNYYEPVIDQNISDNGAIIKCYDEHGKLWIRFQPLGSNAIKTIKVEHVEKIKNLKTSEVKSNPVQITKYFQRFL